MNVFYKNLVLLLISPQVFFRNHKESSLKSMPLFIPVFIILLVSIGIDRLEKSIQVQALSENPILYTTWKSYFVMLIAASSIWWIIGYYIYTWFYNVRIRRSGGEDSPMYAKKIYLYSYIFIGFSYISILFFEYLFYNSPIDVYYQNMKNGSTLKMSIEAILYIVFILAYLHSLFISYKAVMLVPNIKKWRTLFWFVVFPILFLSIWILSGFIL